MMRWPAGRASLPRCTATGMVPGLHCISGTARSPEYYLYLPRQPGGRAQVLVSVHGVSRNALEHIELFRDLADSHGVVLVAPLFTFEGFRDYQRLGRKGRGPRADLALIRILNEIEMATGHDTGKIDMFGFSGGAQFVHRFCYAHSQRVRRLVLGSAGWYTMPDHSLPYPYGTADARGLDAVRFNLGAAARLPTLVVVGAEDDKEDDEELNRSRLVVQSQGPHRLERARAWTAAMNTLAGRQGLPGSVELQVLPGVGHSFRQAVLEGGLARRLFEHCYAGSPPCDTELPAGQASLMSRDAVTARLGASDQ